MSEADPNTEAKLPYQIMEVVAIATAAKSIAYGMEISEKRYKLGIAIASAGMTIGLLAGIYGNSEIKRLEHPERWVL